MCHVRGTPLPPLAEAQLHALLGDRHQPLRVAERQTLIPAPMMITLWLPMTGGAPMVLASRGICVLLAYGRTCNGTRRTTSCTGRA